MKTRGINNFLKSHNPIANAILLAIFSVFSLIQARGQNGYLEIVGPPAIRFETINTNEFLLAAKYPMSPPPKPEPTNAANAVASDALTTNEVMKMLEPETSSEAGNTSGPTNQSTVISVASGADDSMDTTPEMIMPYLDPDPHGAQLNQTNHPATTVFVPTWMGFVPTLLQYPVEPKTESKATYNLH